MKKFLKRIFQTKLAKAFGEWRDKFSAHRSSVSVVLGGDIGDKKITTSEIEKLAEHLHKTYPDSTIIITNSPRTSEDVTKAFIDKLTELGQEHILFLFGKNLPNPYHAMIALTHQNPDNHIYVTGDSISMTYEITDFVPNQAQIILVSSMGKTHFDSSLVLNESRKINLLDLEKLIPTKPTAAIYPILKKANETIANAITARVNDISPSQAAGSGYSR